MLQRIISHMNADHTTSLTRFLQHYCRFSSPNNPQLEEFALDHMIISSTVDGGRCRNYVPISPPMNSFMEAREKMVAMDKKCLEGLGRSDVEVREYRGPDRAWMHILFWLAAIAFAVFCRRANLVPGSYVHEAVLKRLPAGFVRFCYMVQPLVCWGMVAIHSSELVWFERTRLRKHLAGPGGGRGGKVWWKWVASCVVEGVGSFVRFDELIADEEVRMGRRRGR